MHSTPSTDSRQLTKIRNDGADYKTLRLREMADQWNGTVLEPHTVMLLSMLIQEDGTLTAERRHDCNTLRHNGRVLKGCFAAGFMGHNICARGTPLVSQAAGKKLKHYCYDYAMTDFERDYPAFSSDWHVQFAEYTLRMTQCIDGGKTVNQCIQSWNSREKGRIAKVKRHNSFVLNSISSNL